ncbi:LETM1-related biofilm-associated protein [Flavobacterium terrigena]|uniref:LETM1-like protein n=1 Tax=Flavobacterium terrigena TaxID=402734 RepID=A0A1H6QIZ8_9FLAO|nr:LETM1-related biofilm-associated protein [Flavobacterium terrigena]SEI43739.1 LETM1-like protein [Flavobacterium terrigena]
MQINPSINGWIEKYLNQYANEIAHYATDEDFFVACQKSGLIYGYVVNYHLNSDIDDKKWDTEEKIKVGFLSTLIALYKRKRGNDVEGFLETIIQFYDQISKGKFSFMKMVLPDGNSYQKLESIINERLQTNDNIVTKNFTHMVTNAMLFIDVLAFEFYLENTTISLDFFKDLERKCMALIMLSLNIKIDKSEYDLMLLKMFENSLRYSKVSKINSDEIINVIFEGNRSVLESLYLHEVAHMTLLSDGVVYENEQKFLDEFTSKLNLNKTNQNTGYELVEFINKHKKELPFFNLNHPVKQFYNNTQDNIGKLVSRNKSRLIKELSESKELVKLLRKSTQSDLSFEEKKKVKKQLLDICKTIPSLTIFLLPGGGLLLPILIKFIPQLLPSAFNENLND